MDRIPLMQNDSGTSDVISSAKSGCAHGLAPLMAGIIVLVLGVLSQPILAEALDSSTAIVPIQLSQSTAYLVRGTLPILIDCGTSNDLPALQKGLQSNGLAISDLKLLLLTHAHADHAGLAKAIKDQGVQVAVGLGDASMARMGFNMPVQPTRWTTRLLAWLVATEFDGFEPDVLIHSEFDLSRFGINAQAVQMPGHTGGSLVILFSDQRAIVGDLLMGGWFGGALFAKEPAESYVHEDQKANTQNLVNLIERGFTTFYVGHGGPLKADDIKQMLKAAAYTDKSSSL